MAVCESEPDTDANACRNERVGPNAINPGDRTGHRGAHSQPL